MKNEAARNGMARAGFHAVYSSGSGSAAQTAGAEWLSDFCYALERCGLLAHFDEGQCMGLKLYR